MRSVAVVVMAAAVWLVCGTGVRAAEDPVTLVDPFIGTGGIGGPNEGVTADFPGASAPFGMIDWSPDTPTQPTSSGYWYHDTAITGFSMTHVSGAGCQIFGDFDVLPTVGTIEDPAHAQLPFLHLDEVATPGYYAVTLGKQPAMRVQLAASARTGLGTFSFPASKQAHLLINVSSDQAGVTDARFSVVGPDEIAGYASSGSFCGMPNVFTVYFDARFDRPFSGYGTWDGAKVDAESKDARGTNVGGYLTFDTTSDPNVSMKVALSYVSVDGARKNLAAEAKTWDIARVRAATQASWRSLLGEVSVSGNTIAERRMFYTALYHTFLDPNLFSDVDGRYRGFDGQVYRDPPGHAEYANFSGWDTYRTTMSLQALLAPRESSDMIESLVHAAQQGGWLPKWPVANGYTGVMGGDSADPLIASAYAFGARDFDKRAALIAMIKGATDTISPPGQGWYLERPDLSEYLQHGYVTNMHTNSVSPVPNGASETLEYALDDFAIAEFARDIGDAATYREFSRRSANWSNLFDTALGLISARGPDGAFVQAPLTPNGQSGFQEGNSFQYTWMIPQSEGSLVRALGGPAATVAKLDAFFSSANVGPGFPFAWLGNQPTFGSNWAYLWAGAPYREQLVTQEMLTAVYTPAVDGIPGNDDLGSMSAWWAWSAMGMYPVNVSVRTVELGTPLFTHVLIRAPGGPRIEISAPQAADSVPYVESLRIDGRPTQKPWTSLPMSGTLRLDYVLGTKPNVAWGSSPQDAPPNYVAVDGDFPASTTVMLDLPPTNVTLAPGSQAAFLVGLSNANGAQPTGVTWTATAPSGLTVAPAGAVMRVPAYGTSLLHATIVASSSLPSGFYDIAISGRAGRGALLATSYAVVRIARAGERSQFGYVANFSDNTVSPLDLRTGAFGSPIPVHGSPGAIAVSRDGSRIYVANQGGNDVSVIDTATQSLVATIDAGKVPAGIVTAPNGILWVTNYGDNTVMAIDPVASKILATIPVGMQPENPAISPDGSRVYVVNQGSNTVTPIDTHAMRALAAIPVGKRPLGAVVSPDGSRLYVDNTTDGTVTAIDLAHANVLGTIRVGRVPQGIALSPDGSLLYVANSASNDLTPIDTKTLRAGQAIRVGNGPFDVAFTSDGRRALVADSGDNECVVLDVASGAVTARIPTGNFPIAVTAP